MFTEVHFGGDFKVEADGRKYVGGQCKELYDFDTDEMGWFELRYMLKECGLLADYRVHCLKPGGNLDSGLEVVDSDKSVLEILNYLDFDQNVVLYIEHLSPGVEEQLPLPDYCLADKFVSPVENTSVKAVEEAETIPEKLSTTVKKTLDRSPIFRRRKQTVKRKRVPLINCPDLEVLKVPYKVFGMPVEASEKPSEAAGDSIQQHTQTEVEVEPNAFEVDPNAEVEPHAAVEPNATDVEPHAEVEPHVEPHAEFQGNFDDDFMASFVSPSVDIMKKVLEEDSSEHSSDSSPLVSPMQKKQRGHISGDSPPSWTVLESLSPKPSRLRHLDEVDNIIHGVLEDLAFEPGMEFESPQAFRNAIRSHAIKKGFDLLWVRNENRRMVVKCRAAGCQSGVSRTATVPVDQGGGGGDNTQGTQASCIT